MQLPRLKIGDFGCAQRDNGQQRLVLLSISDWLTRTVQAGASEALQFPTSSQAGSAAFHPPEVSLFKVGAGAFSGSSTDSTGLRPGMYPVRAQERPSMAADLWAAGLCPHCFLAGELPLHGP